MLQKERGTNDIHKKNTIVSTCAHMQITMFEKEHIDMGDEHKYVSALLIMENVCNSYNAGGGDFDKET